MAELAAITKGLNFQLEQVQDFTPTPMTVATEIYYTGFHPYTGERVYTARTEREKLAQRQFFFWWKPESRTTILAELRKMHRPDLIQALYPGNRPDRTDRGKTAKDAYEKPAARTGGRKENRRDNKTHNTKKHQ